MTQEEKELLLRDLCARLPYGVVVNYNGLARPLFSIEPTQHFQITLDNALNGEHNGLMYVSLDVNGEEPKPYLHPMSSMTENEKKKFKKLLEETCKMVFIGNMPYISASTSFYDWLNANHFDYRGLIDKGLAIVAPKDMYE